MIINSRNSRHRNNGIINQEKAEEREVWYQLAVKVMVWQDGFKENNKADVTTRISSKEWDFYCQKTVQTNVIKGKELTILKLKEVYSKIKQNKGFERNCLEPHF